jgi:1-acyl-sn-glycerol-3-phosphate acyltransferase
MAAAAFWRSDRDLIMSRVAAAIRTIVWTPVFYLGSLLLVVAAGIFSPLSDRIFFSIVSHWGRWQRWCARWILGQRVTLIGDLPREPMFFAVKHEGMFETVDMPMMLDRPVVFAKQELFSIPLWGPLAKRYGLIPIEREAGASALRTMRKAALDAIAQGRPVVLMPEGTRVPHGTAPPLRAGFAGIYKLLGLPVVPIAVDSGRLRDGWLRFPGTITYQVGEIIPKGLPREEAETRVHAAINRLNSLSPPRD